jgi:ubiquinone/menaquinone biosynthesis C-methylase UbiE
MSRGDDSITLKEKKKVTEINPHEIDWNLLWNKDVKNLPKIQNNEAWDKIAPHFDRWMAYDDYPQMVVEKINTNPEYTVLDIGCGNGAVTIPIAKKVKSVTAMDLSSEMIGFLMKNAGKEGLSNINCIHSTWEKAEIDTLGEFDVVIASRSLGGVLDIKKELNKIDEVAKKYVYITMWGAKARGFEKNVNEVIGRQFRKHPDYMYVVNILYQMGISANVEMLDCKKHPCYADMDEVLNLVKWRIHDLNEEEEKLLREYLAREMVKDENGMLQYLHDKSDWVLIWWKKEF